MHSIMYVEYISGRQQFRRAGQHGIDLRRLGALV
jgi:hypothetical protein